MNRLVIVSYLISSKQNRCQQDKKVFLNSLFAWVKIYYEIFKYKKLNNGMNLYVSIS